MDVLEAIKTRRSIRKYLDKPVEKEQLDRVLEAGVLAPSGNNKQSWAFIAIQNPQLLEEINQAVMDTKGGDNPFYGATALVIACGEVGKSGTDAILATENMCLAAHGLGLGSCIIGYQTSLLTENHGALLSKLNIPEGYEGKLCLILGYADESPELKPREMEKIIYVG